METLEVDNNVVSENDRLLAALIWILSLFTTFLGPILIWFIKRDSKFVSYNFKLYVDLLITGVIYGIICGFLTFILIGIPMLFALGFYLFVMTIVAAVKAGQGEYYKIPLMIRIFSR